MSLGHSPRDREMSDGRSSRSPREGGIGRDRDHERTVPRDTPTMRDRGARLSRS